MDESLRSLDIRALKINVTDEACYIKEKKFEICEGLE